MNLFGEFSTLCGWPKVVMENHTCTPAVHGKSHAWNSRSDWTPRKLTLEFGLTLGWGVGGGSIIFQKAGGLAITTILANIAGTNRSFQILTGSFKIDKFLFWQIKSYLIYQFSNYKVGIAKKYINYVMEKKSSQLFILQKKPICNSLGIKNSNFVGKKIKFLRFRISCWHLMNKTWKLFLPE